MATVYKFKAYYTDSGVGTAQDPAPTCTVINMADDSKLADAQATTASTNMPGLYSYEYSGNDGLDCVAWFKTTDTGCDVKELASYVSEKITTNLNADVAGVETKLDTVDANVDAILADTGTDGVIVASGTVTTLTNLPDAPTDWLTAAAVKADAVTKIQNGLALEATLTAIKGAGWDTQTLAAIDVLIDAIKARTDNLPANTSTTLAAIQADLDNPNQYKADVSGLMTAGAYVAPDNATIASISSTLGTGVALTAAGVDAILDEVVVGTYTMRQLLTVMGSALAGKLSGGGTTTLTFRGIDDASNVIVATVDANGNRSAVNVTV